MTSPETTATPTEKSGTYAASTARHGTIYLVGIVLSRLVGFVMLPLYTRVLTPADYGVLELLQLASDLVTMIAGMGLGIAITRFYYGAADDDERSRSISTAAVLLAGVFAVLTAIGIGLAAPIGRLLLDDASSAPLVRLAAVGLALGTAAEVPLMALKAQQRSTAVVGVGLLRLTLALSLNVALVLWLRLGVRGVLVSTIIASSVTSGYLWWNLVREHRLRFDLVIARRLVQFGAPLAAWNVGSFFLHFSNRFFLRALASMEAVGIFTLAYKLAMLIPMFIMAPFSDIWLPKSLEIDKAEGPAAGPILVRLLHFYNIALVAVSLSIALFAQDLIGIAMGQAFHAAVEPLPLLCLGMVFYGYRPITQVGAMIAMKPNLIATSTAVAAAAAVTGNWLLVPRWGFIGAAIASAIAFFLEFIVLRAQSARHYHLPYSLGRLLTPLGLGIVTWLGADAVAPPDGPRLLGITVRLGALVCFVLLCLVTQQISTEDRRALVALLRQPRRALAVLRGTTAP